MKTELSIPKELLANIDFLNTVNGGMAIATVKAWQDEDGYRLNLKASGFDTNKIKIETKDNRFLISYPVQVLNGEAEMPYFFVNFPLDPKVDVSEISASIKKDETIALHAPFKKSEGNDTDREIYIGR